ncbi:hypothetical protein RclHR1_21330001 [Rhizophagus clarus]|uniref:Uncharacterized protein n=1 Tax=Rhizophagus clarus TaxID=94130 RepID=A0A2Z6QUI1_9GLOM|nr:hypothetical protein RclHR1_21330001 [Rhizophagus clarus]
MPRALLSSDTTSNIYGLKKHILVLAKKLLYWSLVKAIIDTPLIPTISPFPNVISLPQHLIDFNYFNQDEFTRLATHNSCFDHSSPLYLDNLLLGNTATISDLLLLANIFHTNYNQNIFTFYTDSSLSQHGPQRSKMGFS